ncbi:hypothetical protein LEP1GSC127_0212 [Leptospira kirschneri str. 200801925]|nr:hypothetical protein LEP1GSC127_0212 [Leptospira kirschneri str. 200801925]
MGLQNNKNRNVGDRKKEFQIEQILQTNKLILLSSILTFTFYVLIYSGAVYLL